GGRWRCRAWSGSTGTCAEKPAAFPEVTRRGTPQVHGPGPPGRSGASSQKPRLCRVGATHTTTTLGSALVLVESSPGTVLLRTRDRIVQAFGTDRAGRADLLGPGAPAVPVRPAAAGGDRGKPQGLAPARGGIPPPPARAGAQRGLPTYLRHA